MSPRLSDVFLRTQTDERLASLAGHGHERAFGVLVERYRSPLIRAASRLVGADRAEDVAQQTLLRAWSAIQAGTTVGHVSGWLHQILRNTAYTEHARTQEHSRLTDEMADLHSSTADAESRLTLAAVLTEMDRLPEHQRYALLQSEFGGRSRHDVALELGVSEGAVRQLVHRARNTLRMAATAITPFPLAAWAAARPGARSVLAHRMAELVGHTTVTSGSPAATTGGLLGGGALIKGGAVVLTAGALGGGLAIKALVHSSSTHHSVPGAVAVQHVRGLVDPSGDLGVAPEWATSADSADLAHVGHRDAASLTAVNVRSPSVSRTGDLRSGSDGQQTTDGGGSSTQSSGGGDHGSGSSSDMGSTNPTPKSTDQSSTTSTDEQSPTPSPDQSSTTPSTTTTPSTDQSPTTSSTTSSTDQSTGTSGSQPGD